MMKNLRKAIPYEEFDYIVLMELLKEYKKPRDKVTKLLHEGDIIRVKKGLYVFGELWRRHPVSLEILANLIYGPSYLSMEYALAYYGIIPERVYRLTSVTLGRTKSFNTPLGVFSYEHAALERYQIGVTLLPIDEKRSVLFATKEKALADLVFSQKQLRTCKQMIEHLVENLRIDDEQLKRFDPQLISTIAASSHSTPLDILAETIKGLQ